jgi:dTDP-4-dehydrorhamnose 3,5-epimerase
VANDENHLGLWAPASFARGFTALSDLTDLEYLTTGNYGPDAESGIAWDDPDIGIAWPVREPILSDKDSRAQSLQEWLARPEAQHFRYEDWS